MERFVMQAENTIAVQVKEEKHEKLWSLNFFLLWQGQLVSAIGDRMYEIALGFWVMAVTGSTALMGTLMAAATIPRIVLAPIAGVYVDRKDRKYIIVLMDLLRGLVITAVAAAALLGVLQIWMVFAAGIFLGACGAFFGPAVSSAIPDMVPKSMLIKANSVFSMIHAGTNILGSALAGQIYIILGAPIMFLFNGISYIISSFTELFIKLPKHKAQGKKVTYYKDAKEGLNFIWRFRGLRYLIIIAAVINFFATAAIVLILPLFHKNEALGAGRYGIGMAVMTTGMLLGMLTVSLLNIPYNKRFLVFVATAIIFPICFGAFPLFNNYLMMLPFTFIGGFTNAILNSLIAAAVQTSVPADMRGKVFSFMGMVTQGLTPLGMALGGVLGEFISLRLIISGSFVLILFTNTAFIFMNSLRRFMNYNPDNEVLEEIM
jgi:MFS transporter, DHA3 family, macrolide efflux protein